MRGLYQECNCCRREGVAELEWSPDGSGLCPDCANWKFHCAVDETDDGVPMYQCHHPEKDVEAGA